MPVLFTHHHNDSGDGWSDYERMLINQSSKFLLEWNRYSDRTSSYPDEMALLPAEVSCS